MIDITPYEQKLGWLMDWINDKVDMAASFPVFMGFNISGYSVDDIIKIYNQTGVVFYRKEEATQSYYPVTFADYCVFREDCERCGSSQ